MSLPSELLPVGLLGTGAVSTGYSISRSLRFNSADSAYLSRTPASAGNRKTWTWAGWVKRSTSGARSIFGAYKSASEYSFFRFYSNDALEFYQDDPSDIQNVSIVTSSIYRDYSAWAHIVLAFDSSQSTSSDRVKIYVNGLQLTAFSSSAYPLQNTNFAVNNNGLHVIGALSSSGSASGYFNGYLADIHFIDGQALTPTSFGEFDATTGVWMPKAFTGSYGSQGWKLDFADNSSNTATTLGKDSSGNGNNWTPNNLSVTAGAGNDSLVDVPVNGAQTDTGAGGEVRGNYCTLNPLHQYSATLSNGNLDCSIVGGWVGSTIHVSTGKWYAEFTLGTGSSVQMFGVCTSIQSGSGYPWQASTPNVTYYAGDGRIYVDGVNTGTSGSASATAGDIISLAFDADAKSVAIRKNNTLLATKTIGTASSYMFYVSDGGGTVAATFNAGQRPFAYTAPSGFKALCTTNLPAPTITKGSTAMDVVTYTGTGSALTPTSTLGFNPDLIWIKGRSGATDHALYDSVRGAEKRLESNTTDAEVTSDGGVTAFNSNGFTLGTLAQVNTSSATYAAWCWDAGSSTVTNTSGTISSQVRANASAGFSVCTFTSSTGTKTFGHGLGAAPSLVALKKRSSTGEWLVYHISTGINNVLYLNGVNAATSDGSFPFPSPSSTVVAVNCDNIGTNADFVAYCWAPVAGFSAFGSYTGNGSSTDGPFVWTGHLSRWILIKNTTAASTNNWVLYDTARNTYNETNLQLWPNSSNGGNTYEATASNVPIDILSNGFKIRSTGGDINTNTNVYIYASFAQNPFQYSRAR